MIYTKPKHQVSQPEIRGVIDGYYTFEHDDNNMFYTQYKKSWNRLLEDLKAQDAHINGSSFFMILNATSKNVNILYSRCMSTHFYLVNLVKTFTKELRSMIQHLDEDVKWNFDKLAEIWDLTEENNGFYMASNFTKWTIQLCKFNTYKIDHEVSNLGDFVTDYMCLIEDKINELALKYFAHRGLDDAFRYAQLNGELIECDEFMEKAKRPKSDCEWIPPIHRSIKDLVIYGHLIDAAIKIRFLALNYHYRYSQQECYDIIKNELIDLNIDPDKILPVEAKALADRSNRYKKNRFNELDQIARKQTR